MNEQQRLFVTFLTCMGIWFGWLYFTHPDEGQPVSPQGLQVTRPADAPAAAASEKVPASAAPDAAAVQRAASLPAFAQPVAHGETRKFQTDSLVGEVFDADGAFAALSLPAFAPRVLEGDTTESAQGLMLVPPARGPARVIDPMALHLLLDHAPIPLAFVAPDRRDSAGPHTGGQPLVLEGRHPSGAVAKVRITPHPTQYLLDYDIEVTNGSSGPKTLDAGMTLLMAPLDAMEEVYEEPEAEGPLARLFHPFSKSRKGVLQLGATGPDRLSGLLGAGGKLTRKAYGKLTGQRLGASTVDWAGLDEQYFMMAWLGDAQDAARASLFAREKEETLGLDVDYPTATLAAGQTYRQHFRVYAGPKRDRELEAVDDRLTDSIDYNFLGIPLGFLARPMVLLLRIFFGLTHSWGVSIVGLTFVVKLIMLPVVWRGMQSMRRTQEIKPELDRIKARFASDPERSQQEQFKLLKERGINPVGGCLPLLLQMPVWLTLYRMLWGAVDLFRQPFLWLPDLTGREPFPVLALCVGAVTFLQQKVTPMPMQNDQARVMAIMMPVLVTIFSLNMPSGLVLYMLANGVLTIAQQLVMPKPAKTPTKA